MLSLQVKLFLYNALIKAFIILLLGLLVFIFINPISYNQLDARLNDKSNNFIKDLNSEEITQTIAKKNSFTDFTILKEEYISIEKLDIDNTVDSISYETIDKEIANEVNAFRVIKKVFSFEGQHYHLEIGLSLSNLNRLKKTILYVTLFTVLITLSISLIIDLIFSNVLFKPFHDIVSKKIIDVKDTQNYDYTLITTTTKDFRYLDFNLGILIKKINETAEKEKQFIANVSHELLTPISILIARFENILNDDINQHQSEKIYASIKTLYNLKAVINSLLLISKIENAQFKKPDEVFIDQLIFEVVDELEDRFTAKKINININLNASYLFNSNKSLMHTLLFNLINNAIKYSKEETLIKIYDVKEEENYMLFIEDAGFGMEEEKIDSYFNRYKQSNELKNEGHGLGLAIVKSIAEFHQIKIKVKSELNIGTTFSLIFTKD